MFIKKCRLFVLYLLVFLPSQLVWSKDYGMDGTDRPNGSHTPKSINEVRKKNVPEVIYDANGKKKIPPLPRHIILPEVTYGRLPDVEGEYALDFSEHKFWFVTIIASWNERSNDITKIFNANQAEFKKRNIGLVALFAQNTEEEVEKWRLANKPMFMNYYASRNFLDSLKNPKIPCIWLIGSKGEILLHLELPTIQQIDESVQKSFVLTGF